MPEVEQHEKLPRLLDLDSTEDGSMHRNPSPHQGGVVEQPTETATATLPVRPLRALLRGRPLADSAQVTKHQPHAQNACGSINSLGG